MGAMGAMGAVVVRMLTEKKCTANPAMPRPGLVVNDVPAEDALMRLAATPDFSGSRLLKYADPSRFVHDGGHCDSGGLMTESRIPGMTPSRDP